MKEKNTRYPLDSAGHLSVDLRVNPFTVPDNYFEDLEKLVSQRCLHIASAAEMWEVPSGYFAQLEDNIASRIAEEKLKDLVVDPGFSVPDGYFNVLEEDVLVVQGLRNAVTETGFTVPDQYFNTLQDTIANRVYHKKTTVRQLNWRKWPAYAAAACFAAVIGVAGLLRMANDSAEAISPLASVPDQEILTYLEFYGTENDMTFISEHLDDFHARHIGEGVSEADIEAYLNQTL